MPKNFVGDTIYPLNQIKETLPEIYNQQSQKYGNRLELMEAKIPILDCLWNDVIHLLAVESDDLFTKYFDIVSKYNPDRIKILSPIEHNYFQIDSKTLDQDKSVVYLNNKDVRSYDFQKSADEFLPFDKGKEHLLKELSQSQLECYEKYVKKGEKPLLASTTPHVLYKGSIKLSDLSIKKFTYK